MPGTGGQHIGRTRMAGEPVPGQRVPGVSAGRASRAATAAVPAPPPACAKIMCPARKGPGLADDEPIVRAAVAEALKVRYKLDVLQAPDAQGAIELCRTRRPSLVVLDLMMPGLDTFSAVDEIRKLCPSTRFIILTGRAHRPLALRARQHRINAFVLKGDSPEELDYAVRTALSGSYFVSPVLREEIYFGTQPMETPMDQLTPREKAVFCLYAQGLCMKEIANQLGMSVKTAETHRNNFGPAELSEIAMLSW
jgi:DNA-binding NarL/FixJ family response regulator